METVAKQLNNPQNNVLNNNLGHFVYFQINSPSELWT